MVEPVIPGLDDHHRPPVTTVIRNTVVSGAAAGTSTTTRVLTTTTGGMNGHRNSTTTTSLPTLVVDQPWAVLPPSMAMPGGGRSWCAAAVAGNRIVVVGGKDNGVALMQPPPPSGNAAGESTTSFRFARAECYHADTNTWSVLPDMGTARSGCAAAAVLVETPSPSETTTSATVMVVVVGGRDYSGRATDTAECLNMTTKQWMRLPKMTRRRQGCAAVAWGRTNRVIVVGGHDGHGALDSAEYFDFATNAWLPLSSNLMTTKRAQCTAVLLGQPPQPEEENLLLDLNDGEDEIYNLDNDDTIPQKPPPKQPSKMKLIVIGGCDGERHHYDSVEEYDFELDRWNILPSMSAPRSRCQAVVTAGRNVLVLGGGNSFDAHLDYAEVYSPYQPHKWQVVTPLTASSPKREGFAAVVVGGGRNKILVIGGHATAAAFTATATADGTPAPPPPPGAALLPAPSLASLELCVVKLGKGLPHPPTLARVRGNAVGRTERCRALEEWIRHTESLMDDFRDMVALVQADMRVDFEDFLETLQQMRRGVAQERDADVEGIESKVARWFVDTQRRIDAAKDEITLIAAVMAETSNKTTSTPAAAAQAPVTTTTTTAAKTNGNGAAPRDLLLPPSPDHAARLPQQPPPPPADDAKPPEELLCKITKHLMLEPVLATDGHTYEKSAMEKWLETNSHSPVTGDPLPSTVLFPNHSIQSQCNAYRNAMGGGTTEAGGDEVVGEEEAVLVV